MCHLLHITCFFPSRIGFCIIIERGFILYATYVSGYGYLYVYLYQFMGMRVSRIMQKHRTLQWNNSQPCMIISWVTDPSPHHTLLPGRPHVSSIARSRGSPRKIPPGMGVRGRGGLDLTGGLESHGAVPREGQPSPDKWENTWLLFYATGYWGTLLSCIIRQ